MATTKTKTVKRTKEQIAVNKEEATREKIRELTVNFVTQFFDYWDSLYQEQEDEDFRRILGLKSMKEQLVMYSTLVIAERGHFELCPSVHQMAETAAAMRAMAEVWEPNEDFELSARTRFRELMPD